MGSTVAVGGLEISSNTESAQEMVKVLKPKEDKPAEPQILEDAGKPVAPEEQSELSRAASELGKKGGEAAAKARAERDKAEDKPKDESEAKSQELKGEGQDTSEDKPSRAKVRIEELARQRAEERKAREAAEQKAAALEERLARLEARLTGDGAKPAEGQEKPQQRSEGANGKPTPDRFDTYEEFVEALTDWKADQVLERESKRGREQAEVEQYVKKLEEKATGFQKRVAAAREAEPEVLERIDPRFFELQPTFMLPPGSNRGPANDVAQAIVESEYGVRMMLYLSEHPDEMEKVLRLPDAYQVTLAMGRLEARVAEMPPPAVKGVSKAPPPLRPVSPSPQANEPDLLAEMDFDTFYRKAASRKR